MPETPHSSLRLALALAATWLVLSGPAMLWGGRIALEGLTLAAVLCFLPGWLVLSRFHRLAAERPLSGLVVGMSLRLLVVLCATLLVCYQRPELQGALFVVWLIPCYLVALAVETREAVAASLGSGHVPAAPVGG